MEYIELSKVSNMSVFHVAQENKSQYEVGEIIYAPFEKRDFSHWPKYKQEAEKLLEEERQESYPSYPSRINCVFATLDKGTAIEWARFKYRNGGIFYLYELKILDGLIINLDTDFFEEVGLILADNKLAISGKYSLEDSIHYYWAGKGFLSEENSMREIIVYGKIVVVSQSKVCFNKRMNTISEI